MHHTHSSQTAIETLSPGSAQTWPMANLVMYCGIIAEVRNALGATFVCTRINTTLRTLDTRTTQTDRHRTESQGLRSNTFTFTMVSPPHFPPRPTPPRPVPAPHPPGFQPGVVHDAWFKRKFRQGRHKKSALCPVGREHPNLRVIFLKPW